MKQALLVLGMHRSGTSALTYMVGRLGADLPKALLPAIPENNELGFWEPMHLVALHDELLSSAGTSWYDFQAFPRKWYDTDSAKEYRDKIIQLLYEEFGNSDFFVVKDPRICRLVPLWVKVLQLFEAEPNFIIPLRNPLEVAYSLKKRDGIPIGQGTLMWLRHVLEAERFTRPYKRSFLVYTEILKNWQGTAERVAQDLKFDWPVSYSSAAPQIDNFILSGHKHYNFSERELEKDTEVSIWVVDTYKSLMLASSEKSSDFQMVLDEVYKCFERACEAFKGIFNDVEGRVIRECAALDEKLKQEKQNAREQINYRESLLSDLRLQLQEEKNNARAQIEYRDSLVAEIEQQLKDDNENAQSQIILRDSIIAELEVQQNALANSPRRLLGRFGKLLFQKVHRRG